MCFRDCSSQSEGAAALPTALLNQTVTQLLIITSKDKFYFFSFPFTMYAINLPLNLGVQNAI